MLKIVSGFLIQDHKRQGSVERIRFVWLLPKHYDWRSVTDSNNVTAAGRDARGGTQQLVTVKVT